MSRARIVVGALSVSAALVIGHLWPQEGWTESAVIPVKGDVPTVGPGLTKRDDGSPVRMGDTIKPLEGARRSLAHIQKDESRIKQCVTAPLHQYEYDAAVSLSYNIGVDAFCKSTVVRRFNAGDYAGACDAFLMWDKFQGRTLRGLTIRRAHERALCLGQRP